MGLNEICFSIKGGQILVMDPLASINKVSLILQEKK